MGLLLICVVKGFCTQIAKHLVSTCYSKGPPIAFCSYVVRTYVPKVHLTPAAEQELTSLKLKVQFINFLSLPVHCTLLFSPILPFPSPKIPPINASTSENILIHLIGASIFLSKQTCISLPKLPTNHTCFSHIPMLVTYSSPFIIETNLYTAFSVVSSTTKPDFSFLTSYSSRL